MKTIILVLIAAALVGMMAASLKDNDGRSKPTLRSHETIKKLSR